MNTSFGLSTLVTMPIIIESLSLHLSRISFVISISPLNPSLDFVLHGIKLLLLTTSFEVLIGLPLLGSGTCSRWSLCIGLFPVCWGHAQTILDGFHWFSYDNFLFFLFLLLHTSILTKVSLAHLTLFSCLFFLAQHLALYDNLVAAGIL